MMNRKPLPGFVSYNYGLPSLDHRTAFLLLRTDWQRRPQHVLLTFLRDWLKGVFVYILFVDTFLVLLVPSAGGVLQGADFFSLVGHLLFDLFPAALVMGFAFSVPATVFVGYVRYTDLAMVLADEPAYRNGSAFGTEAEREGMARAILESTQFIVTYAPGVSRPMCHEGGKE